MLTFLHDNAPERAIKRKISVSNNRIYKRTKSLISAEGENFNSIMRDYLKQYKAITVGFLGRGQLFGDIDVIKKRPYSFSLKVNSVGSTAYKIKTSDFFEYICHT